tara:strand:+ start:645 stop:1898 length:1254 start_codon:yes stop_codon:yes gene_type:complete
MKLLALKRKISSQKIININYLNLFSFLSPSKINIKNNLKAIFNLKNDVILLGRARTGIYLLVKYFLKNNKNKKVLISPYTIPAVINLIKLAGGKVIFVDSEPNSTFMNIIQLKKIVRKNKPSVIILTHYSIVERNYYKIYQLCRKKNIKLIEDSAISPIGISNKKSINNYSDGSIFSFSSFKLINYFYGGALRCNDLQTYNKILREVSNWKKLNLINYLPQIIKTLIFQLLTSNFIYNFFTFNHLKRKIINSENRNDKIYFSKKDLKKDNTYFSRPSDGCLKEINSKSRNFKYEIQHRRNISKVYFTYLKNLSVPRDINMSEIRNSSCYNYLISVRNANYIRKNLFINGYSVGKTFYENCNNFKDFKSYKVKTTNLDNLINQLIILPTHKNISKNYAKKLSLQIIQIIKSNDYKRLK